MLGLGLNNPTQTADILGNVKIASATSGLLIRDYTAFNTFKAFYKASETPSDSNYLIALDTDVLINSRGSGTDISYNNSLRARFGNATSLLLKGSGSTSATTSFLVQNSIGTQYFKIQDDGVVLVASNTALRTGIDSSTYYMDLGEVIVRNGNGTSGASMTIGKSTPAVASSILELSSITKGFLPPRMLQTQRTAIASPAVGLIVYQTDATEGLYIYKSTGWTFII
jgi:uncharacterized membrane protein